MGFIRLLVFKQSEFDVDSVSNYTLEQWVQLKLSLIDFVSIRQKEFAKGKTIEQVDAECTRIIDKTRSVKSNEWMARQRPGDIIMVRDDYLSNGLPSLGESAHDNGTFIVLRIDIKNKKTEDFKRLEDIYITESGDLNAKHQYRIDLQTLRNDYLVEYDGNKIIELRESDYTKYLIDKKIDGIEKETKKLNESTIYRSK